MPYSDLPPTERIPSKGQSTRPACFGLIAILAVGAFVGAILGGALLGLIDLWCEKQRPDLREDLKSFFRYFVGGGAVIGAALGIILAFLPGRSPRAEEGVRRPPEDRPESRG